MAENDPFTKTRQKSPAILPSPKEQLQRWLEVKFTNGKKGFPNDFRHFQLAEFNPNFDCFIRRYWLGWLPSDLSQSFNRLLTCVTARALGKAALACLLCSCLVNKQLALLLTY